MRDALKTQGRGRGVIGVALMLAAMIVLSACAETRLLVHTAKRVTQSADEGDAQGHYKIGKPYQINGIWYYPEEDYAYDETGIASWYGAEFHGRPTANGETYDMNALTAAHRTLPMPSFVRVTNLENGRSLIVRVNDRGPFAKSRIIDMSRQGAQLLGFDRQGTAKVRVQILADKSRALAARMKADVQLAKVGSPITVDRLPKPQVAAQELAPPSNSVAATAPQPPPAPQNAAPLPTESQGAAAQSAITPVKPEALEQQVVVQRPVSPTSIFVQVGAFGVHENALKMQARLATVGPVTLQHKLIEGRDIYRVRVGPLNSVGAADQMLETVVATGYPDARIVVD